MPTIAPMLDSHADAVLAVYAEGIATGDATFETVVPTWASWDAAHLREPRLVALDGDRVVGWAALTRVSARACYAGVAEVSIYIGTAARGHGTGAALLRALVTASEAAGFWTLQAGIFPENGASLAVHAKAGFRVVGTRSRIAQLRGSWRDVLLLERRRAD